MIDSLRENQVFVFGSNLKGAHGAGAAYQAFTHFGARMGKGEGLWGRSYAFPTLGKDMKKLSDEDLKYGIYKLYICCYEHPGKEFLLTKVGCGIAGFEEDYMRSLFLNPPKNLRLPEDWIK